MNTFQIGCVAGLGQPNETPECRLHNITSACVDNTYHVGIAWRWANANWRRQKRSSRYERAFLYISSWKFGWRCHAFCGASQLPRFERSCRLALTPSPSSGCTGGLVEPEAMTRRQRSEGRAFDSRWCHWIFSLT